MVFTLMFISLGLNLIKPAALDGIVVIYIIHYRKGRCMVYSFDLSEVQ